MKPNTLLTIVSLSALLAASTRADEARVTAYQAQLRTVRVTQLAGETARLVAVEKTDARVAAAADAITAAVSVSAPSAPLVVGSVAKSSPETAATAAATAVKLQPKMAAAIARAAVSAAPSEMEAIVRAMCQASPTSFYQVGVAASQAAASASGKIIPAITTAVPALQPLVARSQADFAAAKRTASLALVLKHTEDLLNATARHSKETPEALLAQETPATMSTKLTASAAVVPVQLPPFVPGGGTPGEIGTGGTVEIPPGGRNYSAP